MLLLALMWGLSIPITKLGLQSLPPLSLTALRFAVAVPLLLLFVIGKPIPWRAMPRLAAVGVLGIGIGQVTQVFGIVGTTASGGTIISATRSGPCSWSECFSFSPAWRWLSRAERERRQVRTLDDL
jgi:O-acetylserine/cysteine efflux transporter